MTNHIIIKRFDIGRSQDIDESTQFSGTLRRSNLATAGTGCATDLTGVFFPEGVRTRAHIHSVDQLLYAVDGRGVVAADGELHLLHPGDWAIVPANTWHWHGATPDSSFTQIAIKAGGETDWNPDQRDWNDYMNAGRDEL
jgi:quercetin dioxygenase-like cupin family protein